MPEVPVSRVPGWPGRVLRLLISPWARCGLLVLLLAAAGASVLVWEPQRLLESGWPRQATGAGTVVVFVVTFAACTLAFVPKPLLNAAAGALFGIQGGLALAVTGTTLGAATAFWLGRVLGRDALRVLVRTRLLRAMDRQLSDHGFRSVLLMRLVPGVPFAVANYSAAVSRMRAAPFLVATALGVIPNTAVYVIAGSLARSPDSPGFLAALGVIAVMGVVSVAVTVWRARLRPCSRGTG
ncbi:hypothetical protein AQ490_19155 [Wenjunlia vitaminophila]|uniref:TVP38/TMEM64 family membrane protein n=1 Tax=Wenjunlia vitaminophila TaxID=76728 RepID=A0A0T6LUW1_WENVI|nr:TVP38/TMEM64 family protein [Wenjunlia vitaminophila]KRV49808.1 hypothetical protein AQ490_19155 [Wenjunlia vitaminophila]